MRGGGSGGWKEVGGGGFVCRGRSFSFSFCHCAFLFFLKDRKYMYMYLLFMLLYFFVEEKKIDNRERESITQNRRFATRWGKRKKRGGWWWWWWWGGDIFLTIPLHLHLDYCIFLYLFSTYFFAVDVSTSFHTCFLVLRCGGGGGGKRRPGALLREISETGGKSGGKRGGLCFCPLLSLLQQTKAKKKCQKKSSSFHVPHQLPNPPIPGLFFTFTSVVLAVFLFYFCRPAQSGAWGPACCAGVCVFRRFY